MIKQNDNTVAEQKSVYTAPRTSKKSKRLVALLGGFAACLAAAAVLVGCTKAATPTVKSAFKATFNQQTKQLEAVYKDIPALDLLINGAGMDKSESDLTLTFNSITGVDGAQDISALLKGTGLRISSVSDSKSLEFNAALSVMEQDVIDFYGFLSPDLAAVGIPAFSDTMVGLDPATIMQDLVDLGLIDQPNYYSMFSAGSDDILSDYLSGEFTSHLNGIFTNLMKHAVYTKVESTDNADIYKITLDGQHIKDALIEAYQYIMSLSSDSSDYDYISFEPLAPAEIIVEIEGGTVRSLKGSIQFSGDYDEPFTVSVDGVFGTNGLTFNLSIMGEDYYGDEISLRLTLDEKYDKSTYNLSLSAALDDGWNDVQTATLNFTVRADNSYSISAELMSMLQISAEGEIYYRGGTLTHNIPRLAINIYDEYSMYGPVSIEFMVKHTASAFKGTVSPSRNYTRLSDLGTEGLEELAMEYMESVMMLMELLGY